MIKAFRAKAESLDTSLASHVIVISLHNIAQEIFYIQFL